MKIPKENLIYIMLLCFIAFLFFFFMLRIELIEQQARDYGHKQYIKGLGDCQNPVYSGLPEIPSLNFTFNLSNVSIT